VADGFGRRRNTVGQSTPVFLGVVLAAFGQPLLRALLFSFEGLVPGHGSHPGESGP